MMRIDRLRNFQDLKENATNSTPRFETSYVNEDYIRWIEFFSIGYGKPNPLKELSNCNVARLLMAPSGEIICRDDNKLAEGLRNILINAY
jgi:hypothetical protein